MTTELRFKIGDKVHVLDDGTGDDWNGRYGTVIDLLPAGPWPYEIEDANGDTSLFKENELELDVFTQPAPTPARHDATGTADGLALSDRQVKQLLTDMSNPPLIRLAEYDDNLEGSLASKVEEFRELTMGASLTEPDVRRDLRTLLNDIDALLQPSAAPTADAPFEVGQRVYVCNPKDKWHTYPVIVRSFESNKRVRVQLDGASEDSYQWTYPIDEIVTADPRPVTPSGAVADAATTAQPPAPASEPAAKAVKLTVSQRKAAYTIRDRFVVAWIKNGSFDTYVFNESERKHLFWLKKRDAIGKINAKTMDGLWEKKLIEKRLQSPGFYVISLTDECRKVL